jgi:hypothetical protein
MDVRVDAAPDAGPAADRPIRYVCMPGSPYTGSTLLGMLLGNHPACATIGAATGLTRRVDLATYECSCGLRFMDCPFWAQVARRTVELGRPVTVFKKDFWNTHVRMSRRRSINGVLVSSLRSHALTEARDAVLASWGPIRRRIDEARASSFSLARAVLDVTGKDVFVDTARDHQRPRHLFGTPGLDVRVIHLVRDPRGNVASILKHTGVPVRKAARQWRHYNREADRTLASMPPGSWMRLRYEDLCRAPQATVERIAGFIGVEPVPVDDLLTPSVRHVIGNSMRLRALEGIREDLSWRQTLTPADLYTIGHIVEDTSRRMGYAWPWDD